MTNRVSDPFLVAKNIHKAFDATPVLKGVDLQIAAGETVCLLGPSGCGKTTLLRVVAGLVQPDRGRVWCAGEDITDVPVHLRDFGLMFQDYALFPHMTVAENIAFGLRMHRWPEALKRQRVAELLHLVRLERFAENQVFELSGGQQQRVALARSLAPKPRLLMLDEPLGSLDRVLRDRLQDELRSLLSQLQQTALYVTHDQWEAFAIADRIVLMNDGRVEQVGTPSAIYVQPATLFVSRFLGFRNELPARVLAVQPAPVLQSPLGRLHPPALPPNSQTGDEVTVVIRPEGALPEAGAGSVLLQVQSVSFRGAQSVWRLAIPGTAHELEFYLPPHLPQPAPGETIPMQIDAQAMVVFGNGEGAYPPR